MMMIPRRQALDRFDHNQPRAAQGAKWANGFHA
jgi:hypothetical protein